MAEVAPLRPVPLPRLVANPLVSVLMASCNHATYVGAAIESVLGQTYQHWEMIVCDDGSADGTADVIRRYSERDARVRLIRQENRGASAALNAAYLQSHGDVICLMDSDDLYHRSKLEAVLDCLRREDAGLLIHAMTTIDREGTPMTRMPFSALERGWLAPRLQHRGGRWSDQPGTAVCLRREVAGYAFPIPPALGSWSHDHFITTLLPLLTPVAALDTSLAYYRVHGANQWHGRQMNAALFEKVVQAGLRVCAEVNARLVALGVGDRPLDLSRNVKFWQDRFSLKLVGGGVSRPALAREYFPLARATLGDEVVNRMGRVRSALAFGGAILLPARWRAGWLTEFFGQESRLRRGAGAFLRLFSRRRGLEPRSRSDAAGAGSR